MPFDVQSALALAVVGGLGGALAWSVRAVPEALAVALRRALTSELEVRRPETVALLDRLIHERGSKRLQMIDTFAPAGHVSPGRGWHLMRHQGRWILIKRILDQGSGPPRKDLSALLKTPVVTLICLGGPGPLKRLVDAALDLQRRDDADANRSSYRAQGGFREWTSVPSHQAGGMGSVALPSQFAADLVSDAEGFLASRAWYRRVGANWCRGYLFEGPPGTGKSKTAAALAQHLGIRLYVLDVGRPRLDDGDVEVLLRTVEPRSVILLDDLDRRGIETGRDGGSEVTWAGLLRALEMPGADGRLVIITANEPDELPKALRRKRRVDRRWRFENLTPGQAMKMVRIFHPDFDDHRFAADWEGRPPAELYEHLLQGGRDASGFGELDESTSVNCCLSKVLG